MQHIVNIAFDFDDEKAIKGAEHAVENELDDIIRNIVLNRIAPKRVAYYKTSQERDWSNLNDKVDGAIKDLISENKDEIIERAVSKIEKSIRSSKAFKEKIGEIMD